MPRTPYEMFVKVGEHNLLEQKRNEESKKSTRKRQRDVFEKTDEYSQQYVGAVTASFVFEYGRRQKKLLMNELFLVELGVGYFHKDYKAAMQYEPLVQQAGRNYRLDKHPTYTPLLGEPVTNNFSSVSSNMESQFEYVVAESGLPFLVTKPFNVKGMDPIFGGKWELPESQFGCMAECCEDGSDLYKWLTKALDVKCWNSKDPPLGMMFPKNHAGPDIVVILLKRDFESEKKKKVTSLALLLIQTDFSDDFEEEVKKFSKVDPALMNQYVKREDSKTLVKQDNKKAQSNFLKQIKNIPVIRVLVVSGKEVSL